ncbi:MAG: metallophosphoesterase, partial [Pseudomonadota bacterium]
MAESLLSYSLTRREFLGTIAAGCGALALGSTGCALQRSRTPKAHLLFYTDVHSIGERQAPKAMEEAVESINSQGADLIINGGDLIHRGFQLSAPAAEKRWDIYMGMHKAIRGEIFSTLGNHDVVAIKPKDGSPPSEDPRAMFRERLGLERSYYSFDALGYHFVVLDSILIKAQEASYGGWIDPEQLEWLKEDLSKLPPS